MLGRVQHVGSGAIPGKMLHHFQEPGQRHRADACTETGKKNRQPEPRSAGTSERGRYCVEVGSRWRFGSGQCFLCFRSRRRGRSNLRGFNLVESCRMSLTLASLKFVSSSHPLRKPERRSTVGGNVMPNASTEHRTRPTTQEQPPDQEKLQGQPPPPERRRDGRSARLDWMCGHVHVGRKNCD